MSNAEKIAQLNDDFRKGITCLSVPPEFLIQQSSKVPGVIVATAGIEALMLEEKVEIFQKIKSFDDFTPDNDPYGEHDFGSFQQNAEKIYWKFDYYDPQLKFGSDDPTDPSKTKRVLTIMLASEY
ncbi:DUF3768 domain-containing protein [Cyclobacterium sp. SYSU L10401]|uniref:DUF3768 domain-containing protein n=1 Tax=Cyclobacterium sp. SYSU L10401 TaxID=2678657 RepID=UPI0013D21AAE|nr:DUF3768 domain-containing protein [Cyclobacterium sp. SYSU L10401]